MEILYFNQLRGSLKMPKYLSKKRVGNRWVYKYKLPQKKYNLHSYRFSEENDEHADKIRNKVIDLINEVKYYKDPKNHKDKHLLPENYYENMLNKRKDELKTVVSSIDAKKYPILVRTIKKEMRGL